MPRVDFATFFYSPSLLSSRPEHDGYRHLSEDAKDAVLPLCEISNQQHASNFAGSLNCIRESMGNRPFLLDLYPETAPTPFLPRNPTRDEIDKAAEQTECQQSYNRELVQATDPTDGFSKWRDLSTHLPNAIPVLQYTDPVTQAKSILRQAALLSRSGSSIALRIKTNLNTVYQQALVQLVGQIYAILESPEQLLLIVDCGQGRREIEPRALRARDLISEISTEVDILTRPGIRALLISNSFTQPQLVPGRLTYYENLDNQLRAIAAEQFSFFYGDYAAVNRLKRTSTYIPSDWVPTICYALEESWIIYRHQNQNDASGWIDGSKAIMTADGFQPQLDTWGTALICRAAANDIVAIDRSRYWTAAKVNIHIRRQIDSCSRAVLGIE